jgi:hypothetical protein
MPTRIKPKVEEISLAYNPANRRKFIMHKEQEGGEKGMKYAISLLEKDASVEHEVDFLKFLKEQKISEDATEALVGAYRLTVLHKDGLPKTFAASMQKSFPGIFGTSRSEKEIRKDVEKELRPVLEKEIREAVEKESAMAKDVEVKKLSDELEAMRKDSEETKKQLAIEKDIRRTSELEKEITSYGVVGDIPEMVKTVLAIEKVNPELAKDTMKSYKKMGDAFSAVSLFKEFGSSRPGEDTATGQLQKLVKDKMDKNPNMSEKDAMVAVGRENPKLYRQYNKEHFRKSKDSD